MPINLTREGFERLEAELKYVCQTVFSYNLQKIISDLLDKITNKLFQVNNQTFPDNLL